MLGARKKEALRINRNASFFISGDNALFCSDVTQSHALQQGIVVWTVVWI